MAERTECAKWARRVKLVITPFYYFIQLCKHSVMAILTKRIAKTVYGSYRYRALKKGLKFELSCEEFITLVNAPCIYCGKKAESNKRKGKYAYNGVDRINNKKGYTVNNTASCCTMCNYMKASYTALEFLNHVRMITTKNVLCQN